LLCLILYMHGIKSYVNSSAEFGIFKRSLTVNTNTILHVTKQGKKKRGSLRSHIDATEELQAFFH